ncbi:GAP family protein [Leifsonia shinshuensis]|uniref:GAP family protein n=1 Tax=Leifsonia shinshuensis TaxID=150026 RepID=UPI001F50A99E|nr:GAP family protein [Leifsonia shinshuensis]MCI0157157.1 GAP family protein [Leifsonia shinshuensis]
MWSQLGQVVAEFFPLAVGVALSPLPLIAAVIISLGSGGGGRAVALVAGRFLGVVVVVGVFAALSELFADAGGSAIVLSALNVLLGLAMMVFGVLTWARRPRGDEADSPPKWMASLTGVSGPSAFGLGFTLSAANVKELAFGAGAGILIGGTLTEAPPTIAAVAIFAAIGTVTAAAPVLAVLIGGERIRPALDRLHAALIRSSRTITAVVLVLFGAVLLSSSFG